MKKKQKEEKQREFSNIECEICGDDISPKRLKALPKTTICVDCADDFEKEGKLLKTQMYSDPIVEEGEFEGSKEIMIKGSLDISKN